MQTTDGGVRMWLLPSGATDGSLVDTSVQVNLSHLASGAYKYQVNTGIQGVRTWQTSPTTFTTGIVGSTSTHESKVVVINDLNSVFGAGWNIAGLQRLVVNDDNSVLLIDGDGTHTIFSETPFPPLSGGGYGNNAVAAAAATTLTYFSPPGDFSKLEQIATGGFLRTTKDGTRYEFNSQGLMVAATDRLGNQTQHIYNALGQIQKIIDPVGLETKFIYVGSRVKYIVDPANRTTTLDYDPAGNLMSITDPDGITKNQYSYDGNHRVTSSIDPTGQLKTSTYDAESGRAKEATREDGSIVKITPIETQGLKNLSSTTTLAALATAQLIPAKPVATYIDGNGNTIINELDRRGKVVASTDGIGRQTQNIRDGNSLTTTQVDARGYSTYYGYDLRGNVTSIADIDFSAYKYYTYDSTFNQLTSVTDELGRTTLYDLDTTTGNVLKSTRVVGLLDTTSTETNDIVTSYTYTTSGQLDLVTDALLHITDYDYDVYGNLIKTTSAKGTIDQTVEQYQYDLAGNRTDSFDALGRQTKYIYNSTNMLLQTIDALGGTTTYNYDAMGHQTRVIDALGHETKMTYDSRGRLISTLDANGGITTDSYDNNGNLIEIRRQKSTLRSEDLVTKYQYDARNRLIGMIAADGGISSTQYDLNNNLTGNIDSLGHQTQQFYDSRNRLIRSVDALGNETKYTYNAVNELIAITDAKGNTTTYQYDELGRQITTTDALGYITRTEYDKLGNITATIDANNNRTEYSYDALNRRTEVKDAQNNLYLTSYDKVGNIFSITDALSRITSYSYDNLDRQTSITDALGHTSSYVYNQVGNIISTTDALNRTTNYGYDNLNRRISTTDALNQTQSITYDILGNVSTATDELGRITSYEYDKLDRLINTTDPLLHTTNTSYDTERNVLSTTDALGNKTSYLYDNNNRQVRVIDAKLGITKTSYDAVGNVNQITDSVNNSTTYSYDAVDRLVTDTNQLGKVRIYSYDAVGNRIQTVDRNGRTIAYNYDTLNRQTTERWLDSSNATIKTFSASYDAVVPCEC